MTRRKVSAPAEDFGAECGRVLGPGREECLLPAGHRSSWCQDGIALQARDYLRQCEDAINVQNLEKIREVFILCWIFGCPVSDVRPDFMSSDTIRREAWWLIWTGGAPRSV